MCGRIGKVMKRSPASACGTSLSTSQGSMIPCCLSDMAYPQSLELRRDLGHSTILKQKHSHRRYRHSSLFRYKSPPYVAFCWMEHSISSLLRKSAMSGWIGICHHNYQSNCVVYLRKSKSCWRTKSSLDAERNLIDESKASCLVFASNFFRVPF